MDESAGPYRKVLDLASVALVLFATVLPVHLLGQQSPVLSTAAQIRALSMEEAGKALPVRLKGTVTAFADSAHSSFFLLDSTGSALVNQSVSSLSVESGQKVEVDGVTTTGQLSAAISALSVKVTGTTQLPSPQLFRWNELIGGEQNNQWIQVRGMVRSAVSTRNAGHPGMNLVVDIGPGGLATAIVDDSSGMDAARLPAAIVRLSGACSRVLTHRPRLEGIRIYVPRASDIVVEQPPPASPYETPLRTIGGMMKAGGEPGPVQRVRVRGALTSIRPGIGFYLQDGVSGILVNTDAVVTAAIGAQVEAVGYPTPSRFSPMLDDAIYRVIGSPHPVAPLQQTAPAMLTTDQDGSLIVPYDSLLVQTRGELVDEDLVSTSNEDELIMRDGDRIFTAQISFDAAKELTLTRGSVLNLTGVCVGRAVESRGEGTFAVLLRSPADIVVARSAPWLNAANAQWMVVGCLVVALAVFFVLMDMRSHSQLKTLAMTDPLTGLYNRRGFLLVSEHNWQTAQRRRANLLLFFFDIEDFKEITEGLGHKQGDRVLQAVGEVLRECFRSSDILARVGGDEFAVLCSANADSQDTIVERFHAALNRSNEQDARRIPLSIGIEELVCDDSVKGKSMAELLQRADFLLKQKRASRSRG